jgi:hypothetical protein
MMSTELTGAATAQPGGDLAAAQGDETGLIVWTLSALLRAWAAAQGPAWAARSASVAELGCGVNPVLLGLAAADGRGAARVLATDYSAAAVARVEASPAAALCRARGWPLEAAVLDWASPPAPRDAGAFDVLLASEVLYYQVDVRQLMHAFAALMRRPAGFGVMASFSRGTSLKQLVQAGQENGLAVRVLDIHAGKSRSGFSPRAPSPQRGRHRY